YFFDDSALNGGSISTGLNTTLEITETDFGVDVASNLGGSIYALGPLVARGCAFDGNSAKTGGAIHSTAETTLEGCSFFGNSSVQEGGAVSNSGGTLTITNCTFGENISDSLGAGTGLGGALRGSGAGTTTVLHSTFVANSTEAVVSFAGHALTLGHCLFQDNTAAGSPASVRSLGTFSNAGYNLCDHSEAEFDAATNDLENTEADLLPAAAAGGITSSYAFGSTSPARDAGDPALASPPATDQRGFARVQGGRIDIGAVEFVGELVVTTNLDEVADPGAGLSLREAITLADPGTTILFNASLSGTTINLSTGQGTQILIEKDLALDASALAGGIRVSGGESVRVFEILGSTVSLNNMTLVDGFASNALYTPTTGGGALRIADASTVTMTGGAVRRCLAGAFGGGVHTAGNSAFIADGVEFTGNETLSGASGGGAIQIGTVCAGTLRKCSLTGNTASVNSGGAIYNQNLSSLEISGCTLSNNTSKNGGGAIAMESTTYLDMVNTTISGNEAGVGSTGNVAGGALLALPGAYGSIRHCTIANNKQRTGAGIEIANSIGSSFSIGHTILSGNTNPNLVLNLNGNTRVTSLGYNLTEDASVGTPPNSSDRVNRGAFLAPLGNYGGPVETHALLAISPALDAGDPFIADAPGKDARRFARIADGDRSGSATIDIGAFEAKRPYVVSHNLDEMNEDGQRSLREAIADAVSGDRIVFNPSLSNATIDLSSAGGGLGTQLTVANAVQIDATLTIGGVTVSGGDAVRVFVVGAAGSLAMHAVNVRDGFAGGGNNGGGFRVLGQLLVTHACLEGNRAQLGGGLAVEA
ncbi:MAG TPA: right-handed parallel beta-helix repeat-containing protein, partial [Phycisphaerae bacterium]|nr:right-handed parallel beta-helix repeat-containing protein [Phycisphaerae bacterium]